MHVTNPFVLSVFCPLKSRGFPRLSESHARNSYKGMKLRTQPDNRAITRLVPPSGNLVQGQSELTINPSLAQAASELISASRNH